MKKYFLLLLYFAVFTSTAQSSSFQITYNGATPQAKIAIDRAAEIWSNILVSNVPIKVNVNWINASSLFLGVTISNGVKDFVNAPMSDVWYPSSLADAIAGTDLNPSQADIDIYLDNSRNWYYEFDANGPFYKLDLVNVAFHEFAHGLGFYSVANIDSLGLGSFSLEIDPVANALASFSIPNLQGKPLIFDVFIENFQGEVLVDTNLFPNPSIDLAHEFTSDSLFFNGPNALNANNNNRPKLYSPSSFSFGSSFLHLDESVFPPNSIDALMTPYCSPGEANHIPGPVTIGVLQDLGWVVSSTIIEEQSVDKIHDISIFPNPSNGFTKLNYELAESQHVNISIYNLQGQKISTLIDQFMHKGEYDTQIEFNQHSGLYFIVLKSLNNKSITKLLVK